MRRVILIVAITAAAVAGTAIGVLEMTGAAPARVSTPPASTSTASRPTTVRAPGGSAAPTSGFAARTSTTSPARAAEALTSLLSWSASRVVEDPVNRSPAVFGDVSCAAPDLCVGTDNNSDAFTWVGSDPYPGVSQLDTANDTDALDISCPAPTFCEAALGDGNAASWNGTSWSQPQHVDRDSDYLFGPIACATSSFCVAGEGASGDSLTFDGSTWSAAPISGALISLSCPTPVFCMAASESGYLTWDGGEWSSPREMTPRPSSVSCASSHFCAAVATDGQATTWNGASWTNPVQIDDPTNYLQSVSCPAPTFCVAVDLTGHAFVWDGATWSPPAVIDPPVAAASGQRSAAGVPFQTLVSISCPTERFCAAVDTDGRIVTGAQVTPGAASSAYQHLIGTWRAPGFEVDFSPASAHPGALTTQVGGVGTCSAFWAQFTGVQAGSGSLELGYDFADSANTIVVDDGTSVYTASRA